MFNKIVKKYRFVQSLPVSLRAMIVSSFLVALGSFMVTPFLGVILHEHVKFDLQFIGSILAVATFIQFAGGLAGGIFADKFGLKESMIFSLSFRTVGFFMLAYSIQLHWLVLPAVFLVVLGSAFYMPANKAYVISLVKPEQKPLFLSISNAAFNAGMALGPFVSSCFIKESPQKLFFGISILFVVITLLHHRWVVSTKSVSESEVKKETFSIFSLKPEIISPVIFNTFTFYLYFYFQNFMSLYSESVSTLQIYGILMLINFSLMFILQLSLVNWIAQASYARIMLLGFSFLAVGIFLFGIPSGITLALGTIVMTIGEAILFLRGDLEIVKAIPDKPAVAFGIQRLSAGVGGLVSGLVGGSLYKKHQAQSDLQFFWFNIGFQAVIIIILFLFVKLRRDFNNREIACSLKLSELE